jgi:hypothetical protein
LVVYLHYAHAIGMERLATLMEGKREPMAAYRFGSLEGTLRRPGVIGLMSTIG